MEGIPVDQPTGPSSSDDLFERCGPAEHTQPMMTTTTPITEIITPIVTFSPPLYCPDPPQYSDMRIISGLGGPYEEGHEIGYKCLVDLSLSASVLTTYCKQDGKWTAMVMMCPSVSTTLPPTPPKPDLIPCGNPPFIPNASYQQQGYEFYYRCKEGFRFLEVAVFKITCNPDTKRWEETGEPRCYKIVNITTTTAPPIGPGSECSQFSPPSIENGFYKYLPDEEGYLFSCEEGYQLVGESFYSCWNDGPQVVWPECKVVTPEPPVDHGNECKPGNSPKTISHGSYKYDPVNQRFFFSCEDGYDLVGVSWIKCTDGYWDMEIPHCELIKCQEPSIPENGRRIDVDGKIYSVGKMVKYVCYSGYNLLGSEERTCQKNRKWSGSPVTCESEAKVNHCPVPVIPDGGRKNGDRYEVGNKVSFACEPGALLYGSRVQTCLANRKWSGEPPVCDPPLGIDTDEEVMTRLDNIFIDLTLKSHIGINVYFVFDASDSIEESEFKQTLKLAKRMVGELGISTTTKKGATFAAATFASTATTIFQTTTYQRVDQCQSALDTMDRGHLGKRGTNIKSGLVRVRKMIKFTQEQQVIRRSAKSIIFLFSDGLHNEGGDPLMTADMLKEDGAEIYAVSMKTRTHAPNMKRRLALLASSPTRDHTAFTSNFNWNYIPDYFRCGPPGRTFSSETRGDSPALGGAWPWTAKVYLYNLNVRKFVLACTAALVDPSHVILASSCVRGTHGPAQGEKKVVFGPVDGVEDENTQVRRATHVFDEEEKGSYLAMLRLDEPVELNRNIRTVCLPTQDKIDRYGVVLGWCSENDTGTAELRQNDVQIEDVKECETEIQLPVDLAREHCISSEQPRSRQCRKSCSSGNILVVEDKDEATGESRWTLSGVTLTEPDSCGLNRNMIYSRVSAYLEWIRSIINKEGQTPLFV
jgi:hypothetical protein